MPQLRSTNVRHSQGNHGSIINPSSPYSRESKPYVYGASNSKLLARVTPDREPTEAELAPYRGGVTDHVR